MSCVLDDASAVGLAVGVAVGFVVLIIIVVVVVVIVSKRRRSSQSRFLTSLPCFFHLMKFTSNSSDDIVLETRVYSVLMLWSWSWSCLGPFKLWFLISEVQNHVRNYDISEKWSFFPKNLFFIGFKVHLRRYNIFSTIYGNRDIM